MIADLPGCHRQPKTESGTGLLACTSIVNAATTTIRLAADHQATEQLLRDSGVPHVLLRNSWYHENYTSQLPAFLTQGTIPGSAGGAGHRCFPKTANLHVFPTWAARAVSCSWQNAARP